MKFPIRKVMYQCLIWCFVLWCSGESIVLIFQNIGKCFITSIFWVPLQIYPKLYEHQQKLLKSTLHLLGEVPMILALYPFLEELTFRYYLPLHFHQLVEYLQLEAWVDDQTIHLVCSILFGIVHFRK